MDEKVIFMNLWKIPSTQKMMERRLWMHYRSLSELEETLNRMKENNLIKQTPGGLWYVPLDVRKYIRANYT